MKNGGQQKCLDKALGDKKGENFAYVLNEWSLETFVGKGEKNV